jgi:hypothetical protein
MEEFIMRIEITKSECQWLIDLVKKDKETNAGFNEKTPHQLYELRRDNMESLEYKLESAVIRQLKREEYTR